MAIVCRKPSASCWLPFLAFQGDGDSGLRTILKSAEERGSRPCQPLRRTEGTSHPSTHRTSQNPAFLCCQPWERYIFLKLKKSNISFYSVRIVSLICISVMANDAEEFFMCLFNIHMSTLLKYGSMYFAHLKIYVVCFLVFQFWGLFVFWI